MGLEKCAGDHEAALEFTKAFVKEAFLGELSGEVAKGAGKAIGMGATGLAVGLGIHGISSTMSAMSGAAKREKFEIALAQALAHSPILQNAPKDKVRSFAETMFKFAPTVCADANIVTHVLDSAVMGESMDMTTIRSLADLESRVQDTKKNALFTPKVYS